MSDVYFDGLAGGWRRTADDEWVTYDTSESWLVARREVLAADLAGFDAVIRAKRAEAASVEFEGLRLVQ